jgi:hypothetical protein
VCVCARVPVRVRGGGGAGDETQGQALPQTSSPLLRGKIKPGSIRACRQMGANCTLHEGIGSLPGDGWGTYPLSGTLRQVNCVILSGLNDSWGADCGSGRIRGCWEVGFPPPVYILYLCNILYILG